MNKLVSIIIPTYSRPDNLCRAIDSVLSQTYAPIEIIVVDDNGIGTEAQVETEGVLQQYIEKKQIIYLKHEVNKNGSAARNTGVRASKGEIIGLMDDDDVFVPEKIAKQVARLEQKHSEDATFCASYCSTEIRFPNKSELFKSTLEGNLAEDLMMGRVRFNSSALLLYKSVYCELGGFDERFKRHQDYEFCLRYFRKYNITVACPQSILLIKYSTPNVVSRNPYKSIEYNDFLLKTNKVDFDNMQHPEEVYHKRYFTLATILAQHGYIKDSIIYYAKSNSYRAHNICDYRQIFRSVIGNFFKFLFREVKK